MACDWITAAGNEEIDLRALKIEFKNHVDDIVTKECALEVARAAAEAAPELPTRVALRRRTDRVSNRVRYGVK